MKHLTKSKLAFVIAAAMGIAGCGSDGKDGQDGAPGEPGEPSNPPVVEMSEVTTVTMINHALEEGQIRYEFEVTNEDGELVNGLAKAEAKFAEKTERGVVMNRDGAVGGYTDTTVEGAVLNSLGDGHYEFIAPMPAVTAASEGIVWLRVGGDDTTEIARSQPMVVAKAEMIHTTTTETCQSCHVDYAASNLKHPSYTAINADGEVDLVGGCMVCHNNVSKAEENGGYATNTFQKIGHINHQEFEKDFTPTNCYTCHAEPVMNNGNLTGNGCTDCHNTGDVAVASVMADPSFDMRELHASAAGVTERKSMRENYSTETSAVYHDADLEFTDHKDVSWVGAYCVDVKLFDNSGETPVQLNIGEMYEAHEVTYAGAYVNAYDNETDSIVARVIGHGAEGYVEREDGTRSVCYGELLNAPGSGYENAHLTTSSRVTLADTNWQDDDGKFGVSFTGYSEVVDNTFTAIDKPFSRRHNIDANSCTTCHTNETNYHKNGSYNDGGESCIACHNNGQDRSSKNSAPGFGPMVHSMHWGIGNALSGSKVDEDGNNIANSADRLNAENCVSCHAEGIDLEAVPNRYMRAKAFHGGDTTKMASPITANCFSCHEHNTDSALNHMEQNGGTIDAEVVEGWYTQPTSESCATCHAEGKSFGIEKFHNFER
ncbi:hypothetical protein Q4557_19215 [Shewanella sp. 5_MG-2023]|uniref:multiheme c-type cytochrome n=1 Tax=Shewanella sp. 5_MG-2023 TaxID=3062656 RepID=UPI0026E2FCE2|nr:hypothetical protein [Shewanella sp. 5_MG-2023]MDO6642085.1 hypothetical protein [Shewanella sp. 5_MG-2023]